jgi:hypothetical protein
VLDRRWLVAFTDEVGDWHGITRTILTKQAVELRASIASATEQQSNEQLDSANNIDYNSERLRAMKLTVMLRAAR